MCFVPSVSPVSCLRQPSIVMADRSGTPEAGNVAPIPDDDHTADLPLTMSASVVLTALPLDAHTALAQAGALDQKKGRSIDWPLSQCAHVSTVMVRFKAVGSAPILRQQVYKISASQRFETVVNFLRTRLKCPPTESVFLYVNSVFAPALDEIVGNLFRVGAVTSRPCMTDAQRFSASKQTIN